jgi:hypothetical protein
MTPAGVHTVLFLVAMAAACSGSAPPGADLDAGDGDGPDASEGAGGLLLRFHATQAPGAALGGEYDCTLGDIAIGLADLRVLGDAAPSDDTRKDAFDLAWGTGDTGDDDGAGDGADGDLRSGDGDGEIRTVQFDHAPPGLYSSVRAAITDYAITGTATTEGVHPFVIADEQAGLGFTLSFDEVMLEAGETLVIDIDVALEDVVRVIDWSEVPAGEGGTLRVDDESSQIDDVEDELEDAFDADLPDPD